jgi:hypothetical protein
MANTSTKKGQTLSLRLYALLLAAYPREFRREYGREMTLVFADRCREGARGGEGRGATLRLWGETFGDLLKTAPKERLENFLEGGGLMRVLRTGGLALIAYAFTLLVIAPWFAHNHTLMPGFVASLLDALIFTGLVFNFIYLALTLPRWREGLRAVRLALYLTTLVVGALLAVMALSVGPAARPGFSVLVAQVLALLLWFTAYLWWVLRRGGKAEPPAATA